MRTRELLLILVIAASLALAAGCSQPVPPGSAAGQTVPVTVTTPAPAGSPGMITPADLTARVKEAAAYARANGRENATAAFNDPNGPFTRDNVYVFAEDYNGMALAEPFEHGIVGTSIRNMTDRYGVPLVRNLAETAGYGIGYVSYDYPDPADNGTVRPKLSVVADVDGTYYVGAGA